MSAVSIEKRVPLGARTTPETKEKLQRLANGISRQVKTRVSLSQALEIAINEALEAREKAGVVCEA